MTGADFRRAHRPVRCWQPYSSDTRANLAASRRVGFRRREATGEHYYVHPLIQGRAFPTAGAAHRAGWQRHLESEAGRDAT